jgi:histidinol-phosphate/aromatic aminotransferase/cobyric acid decarboxylase-like protein
MGITLTDKSVRFAIRNPKENKEVLKIVSEIINWNDNFLFH